MRDVSTAETKGVLDDKSWAHPRRKNYLAFWTVRHRGVDRSAEQSVAEKALCNQIHFANEENCGT